MAELSEQRQPDAHALSAPANHPSLSLYASLLLAAIALTWGAFAMQEKPDWPGLMINLAAGLVGSVIVLIFVDHRLRDRELAALRRLPLLTRYLLCEEGGRIPILFALAHWAPERKLYDALHDNFLSYARCSRWTFDRMMKSGTVVVLLDGYEELWRAELPLEEEVKRLREIYPRVAWTLTATDEYPDPTDFGKVVTLAHPSKAEMAAIKLRLARDPDEVVNC